MVGTHFEYERSTIYNFYFLNTHIEITHSPYRNVVKALEDAEYNATIKKDHTKLRDVNRKQLEVNKVLQVSVYTLVYINISNYTFVARFHVESSFVISLYILINLKID
jgi:hypothetical protein